MEILTLKGNGKSKFLSDFIDSSRSEKCFVITFEDENISRSLFSRCDNFILDDSQSIKEEMEKYLGIVENWSDKLEYLIIYSIDKSEKDMINCDVYYLLNQVKDQPFFKELTCIVACKE